MTNASITKIINIMKLEQIKEIIENYEKLYELASSKIKVLENLDSQYTISRGIEDISFYDDMVNVICDDGMGYYRSFIFPTIWLSKTDSELEEIVIMEKELKVEKERKLKKEKQLKEKLEKEQREFEQYQRLKAKYEQ
jgi:hypothetical protein